MKKDEFHRRQVSFFHLALFALVAVSATSAADDFVLIKPGVFPQGHSHGRYGGLTKHFPLAINPQFYGDSEMPFHYTFVTRSFHLSKTEVTVGEFREFVEATNYQTDAEKSGKGIIGWSPSEFAEGEKAPDWRAPRHDFLQKPEFSWKNPGFPQSDNHPVVGVSWNDAIAYCAWRSKKEGLKYRLPTEAEWEMAARAGEGDQFFSWGNEAHGVIHKHANIGNVELEKVRSLAARRHWLLDMENDPGDGYAHTAPVGSFAPNPWGLNDLSGNVFEWCQDYFNFNFYDQWKPKSGPNPVAVDPVNTSLKDAESNEFRVIRGGSWYTGPLAARSSARGYFDAPEAAAYIGFRLVREATAAEAAAFANPHEAYLEALKTIVDAGGNFRPVNSKSTLEFRSKKLTDQVILAIANIPGLYQARGIHCENWTQELWNALAGMEKLAQLSVEGETLRAIDLSPIAQSSVLTLLQISATGLEDKSVRELSGLTTLHEIFLSQNCYEITDDAMRVFAANTDLKSLAVYDSTLTGEFLSSYGDNPFLANIWVGGPGGDDEAGRGWTVAGSRALVETRSVLRNLTLQKQPMTDAALEPLAALSRLEKLDLRSCRNLTDAGIAALLKSLTGLRTLDLSDTKGGRKSAEMLPAIPGLKNLTLEVPNLTDASLESIARSRCLSEISLRQNDSSLPTSLTAAGVAKLGRCPRLEKLNMECRSIVFGKDIAELSASPSLREITVPIESLTDDAIAAFAAIRTLEKLNLRTHDQDAFELWSEKIATAVERELSVNRR